MTRFATDMVPGISPEIYGEADFEAVRKLVHGEAGIVLPVGKAMLVYSRLAPLVRSSGAQTFGAYIDIIRKDAAERQRTICALTTNHTFFFRESHHFDHFRDEVRPSLLSRLDAGGAVRIWSAGSSSGEELWSLVMTTLGEDRQTGRRIAGKDIRFLATDIAVHALESVRQAQYAVSSLKAVPDALRQAWIKEQGDKAVIAQEARDIVRVRELNLLGDWPMHVKFDAIFCRNVMIYFDQPTKERLVARFAQQLAPGGHLYIGHSERVTGEAAQMLRPVGPTIYRKEA